MHGGYLSLWSNDSSRPHACLNVFLLDNDYSLQARTSLLRAMSVRCAPPYCTILNFSKDHEELALEGWRLRSRLPAYVFLVTPNLKAVLAQIPLPPPLRALVEGYLLPMTTDEA
jgi:hypothetical protein